jgi:hypothetical protein
MEGSGSYLIDALFRYFPGGTGENNRAGVPAQIPMEHLLHTSLQRYP